MCITVWYCTGNWEILQVGFIICSTLSCDVEKRHGLIPKISFPTDKLQQDSLKPHSVKDNLLRMNTCMMLSAILMQFPELMKGLRKGLIYQIAIYRSPRQWVVSKKSHLIFPRLGFFLSPIFAHHRLTPPTWWEHYYGKQKTGDTLCWNGCWRRPGMCVWRVEWVTEEVRFICGPRHFRRQFQGQAGSGEICLAACSQ